MKKFQPLSFQILLLHILHFYYTGVLTGSLLNFSPFLRPTLPYFYFVLQSKYFLLTYIQVSLTLSERLLILYVQSSSLSCCSFHFYIFHLNNFMHVRPVMKFYILLSVFEHIIVTLMSKSSHSIISITFDLLSVSLPFYNL